jgi:membrane protein required for colicin V production
MELNWLDIVILLPIVYGLGHGLLRGFVRELTSIFAVLGGVLAGKFFAPKVASMLLSVMNMPDRAALLIAYVLLFFGVALVCKLLAKIISKFLCKLDMNWLNRLVGAVFGAAVWALIVSLLLNFITFLEPYYPIIKDEAKQESKLYQPTHDIAAIAKGQLDTYMQSYTKDNAENKKKE